MSRVGIDIGYFIDFYFTKEDGVWREAGRKVEKRGANFWNLRMELACLHIRRNFVFKSPLRSDYTNGPDEC